MGNTLSAYEEKDHTIELGSLGSVKGVQYDNKARRYAGVPYALPPIREFRWRKPRPLPADYSYNQPGGSPFDASEFYPVCPQPKFSAGREQDIDRDAYSEDCLRLNIWTPVPEPSPEHKKWPVVLWLHGGWFQMGDPAQEITLNPTELISTGKLNAIVIGIGYRLNLFGFLAGEALEQESGGESVGNYGLWDQRLAIEWVKEHIEAFNGDVNNISLGGRSAGAYWVHAQSLYDFRAKPFDSTNISFHRLYLYSNAIPAQPKTAEEAQPQFDELCQYFKIGFDLSGPGKLAELRKIKAHDLISAIKDLKYHTFRPVTDGIFIHTGMHKYHTDGSFAAEFKKRNLRLLIGEVLNEETLYSAYNGPEPNLESLRLQISNYYAPATTERILQHYPLPTSSDKQDWMNLFGTIISDGQVRAPSRFLVNSLVTHGVSIRDIWRYQVAYRLSFIDEKVAPPSYGVAHGMDKPFWNFAILHGPTPDEHVMMQTWIKDLVAFVNNDRSREYGTTEINEFKVATQEGKIMIQEDSRWGNSATMRKIRAFRRFEPSILHDRRLPSGQIYSSGSVLFYQLSSFMLTDTCCQKEVQREDSMRTRIRAHAASRRMEKERVRGAGPAWSSSLWRPKLPTNLHAQIAEEGEPRVSS
ncbi:alpha/beta-hydrolase [Stipitochalara longipes BDJ]|nr:alpha/beta-hydrolase [Stipitochalara longipes BDJ]